jgi:predicted NUDIX family NTP pyrophosphohydrolase
MYRRRPGRTEVFLVHPGGPYGVKKDAASWSIPKGEYDTGEEPIEVAKREFFEETGFTPGGTLIPLSPVTQSGGKVVTAWAFEGDCDASKLESNTFSMEWPPGSGRQQVFPEVDRGDWFPIAKAKEKIIGAQAALLHELSRILEKEGEE